MMNRAMNRTDRYRAAVKAIGGPAAIYGLPKPVQDALKMARTQEAKARILEAYAKERPELYRRIA